MDQLSLMLLTIICYRMKKIPPRGDLALNCKVLL
jgi:hypothetical protein